MTKLARRVERSQKRRAKHELQQARVRADGSYKSVVTDRWESLPYRDYDRRERYEPPTEKPHNWYQFCVEMKYAYERVGEHLAALVYWTMRFLDEPNVQLDPVTEAGYKELCAYWDYKASWFEEKCS